MFDKAGTLTMASPVVVGVVPFVEEEPKELLRLEVCLEEHFPHSMAKAVVDAVTKQGVVHEEKHSRVEYIVAHGISSYVEGKKQAVVSMARQVSNEQLCRVIENTGYKVVKIADA